MATYNAGEHTFVATPVQMDQNCSVSPFATSHFITTSTPSSVMLSSAGTNHRQTTAAVTSSSTSSSYTFLQIKREPCQVSEVTTSNHCHQQQQQQQQHQLTAATQHHQQQQQQQQQQHHHHGVCSATSSTSLSATTGSKTVSASTLTTLVKIEPPSPKVPDFLDKSSSFGGNTNNSVPIGIAVARKRPQESTLANCNSALALPQTLSKDLNCFGIRVADLGGVGTGCGNIFFTGNGDLMTGSAASTAEELALQSVNRAPSTFWQYPSAALPFESVISMSPATVGLQYSREASRAAGQVVLLPAATAAALGISNIPPLCYTPTDPFQQAAAAAALVWPSAAAAYLPQGTATGASTATLQSPHNFLFPTMNSAHTAAAAAATLQPQSYPTAASLQLFGSSYLRNATEFMAAAGKTTTTMQQNHMIAASAANPAPTALAMPPTSTALSFETRDKTTMTTTTATNLLELQGGNTQTALNLIRLPTPPTSATIGDGQNTATTQLQATPQILFQTAAASATPTPTLLNLSTNGTNNATLARTTPTIGPPTPVGDDHNATTDAPLALNFKTTTATTCSDASGPNATSIVVGVSRNSATAQMTTSTMQPQMQDVNIQTDTPVCSEDENSSCPIAALQQQQQQQQQAHSRQFHSTTGESYLTPPTFNGSMNNEDDCTEPLELIKSKSHAKDNGMNEIDAAGQHQFTKENTMCHNERNELSHLAVIDGNGDIGNRVGGKPTNETSENTKIYETQQEEQLQNDYMSTMAAASNESTTTADDFTGLELLCNISASSLPNKPALNLMNAPKQSTLLRVKQEPLDAMEEIPQQEAIIMPTIAAKIEHNISTGTNALNEQRTYEQPPIECNALPTETSSVGGLESASVVGEPLGGLNLLCALAEQRIHEEEEEQGGNFFATDSANQRTTPTALLSSSFGPFLQQQSQHQSPFRLDQSSFPSMEGIELPSTSNAEMHPVASSSPQMHIVKRKKHKHSKSSKSSKCSSTISATAMANGRGGSVTPSILCSGKISKRANKKNKKKYSKEKKRQQRAEAAAAAVAVADDLDFDDEQLQEELQRAFISGTTNDNRTVNSSNVKWPSAEEIFNIMESRMRQRLADITRQYRKKKRKLDEISKTQRKRKKCSKLIAQQLQQQQSLLSSSLSAANLSLNGSATIAATTTTTTTTTSLADYKFTTSKFTSPASAGGPSTTSTTASPYLQPSSFPLRFPPLSASTADEDSDKNSHSRTKKRNHHIYKPVRLEPSSLSAAIIANGACNSNSSNCNNNNHTNNNNNGSNNNSINNSNNNNNASTNGVDASGYSLNTAFRLAQKHASSEPPALTISNKERKIMSKEKTNRVSLGGEKTSNAKIKKSKPAKDTLASNVSSIATEQPLPRSGIDHKLTLTNEHLYRNETRVLTDMGGLFYAGVMKPLQPPDIYAITLDGERGNKPHIMSREEIFKDTILEIAPKSVESVPVGTRLCAYWSQQYRCLYPGRAIESESSEGEDGSTQKDFVSVEFDDGDSGRIRLQNIRLLMSDYPIVEYNDNPLYSLGKQQKKSGFKSGANSTIADTNSNPVAVQLFDTNKLGHPSMLPLGMSGNDTEMYARRTEKKRLKKNPKKKLLANIIPLNGVPSNNVAGSSTNIPPGAIESSGEHNRKHHKHKKHKKHKKHHRKTEEATEKSFTSSHKKSDANDSITSGHLERLKLQDAQRNQEQNTNTTVAMSLKPIKLENNTALGSVRVKTERMEDIEEESVSNMMSENSDEVKGDEDDEIEHNNSKGSKIAAFLPERQLWGWLGIAYRKAGVKGRARKQFYKTIKRGKELITVGDCAVFLSTGRPDRPYIGRIESMWETASSNKVVRVRWFYHPEETTGCPNLKYPGALFESPHEDENDVQTISHRCEVLPFERYFEKFGEDAKQYQSIYDNNDTYYLAGYYNPRVQALKLQENIPTTTASITFDSSNIASGAKVNNGVEKKEISTSAGTSNP